MCLVLYWEGSPAPPFIGGRAGALGEGGSPSPTRPRAGRRLGGEKLLLQVDSNSSCLFPTVSCFWQFDFQTGHLTFLF